MGKRPPFASAGSSRPPWRRGARFPREIEVLYQDAAVIVINKPPGLASVPVKGLNTPSALEVLRTELPPPTRVFVVHRIDRFTSGAILFAATAKDREVLIKQFLEHTPDRQYVAVVQIVDNVLLRDWTIVPKKELQVSRELADVPETA